MQLAKQTPVQIARPGVGSLGPVEDKLQAVLSAAGGVIRDAVLGLAAGGGKRVRPFLVVTAAQCRGKLNEPVILAATAAELIHMASLVHDDIIDRADLRRGKPTVNAAYGPTTAVLTGDYLFAQAFDLLAAPELLPSMRYLLIAIKEMCMGEVDQASALFSPEQNLDSYYQRIARKTGALLKACCQAGAAAAGADLSTIGALANYGLFLGYAYQITDDLLDFTGNVTKLGKPVGADLQSGNVTLPVILLMNDPSYAGWLRELIATRRLTATTVAQITNALHISGCLNQARAIAEQCVTQAKSALAALPDNSAKAALINLAESILPRADGELI